MQRFSPQREIILQNLRGRTDHPTAEMVYESLHPSHPHISLGTIYRNLALLTDIGEILKIGITADGKERYDGCVRPHAHFTCESCGSLADIPFPVDIAAMEASLGVRVHTATGTFSGLCRTCLQSKQKQNQ